MYLGAETNMPVHAVATSAAELDVVPKGAAGRRMSAPLNTGGRGQVFYSAAVEEVACSTSRSRRHTLAASYEINRRRPTSISTGPHPTFFIS